jgi:hypothetical protein
MILFISVTCLVLANAASIADWPGSTKKSQRILCINTGATTLRLGTQCSEGRPIDNARRAACCRFLSFQFKANAAAFCAFSGTEGIRDHRNSTKAVNIKIKAREPDDICARVIKPRSGLTGNFFPLVRQCLNKRAHIFVST